MKKILILLLLVVSVQGLNAQEFGNEWIQYNQKYYKFKIAQTGIYRIDYDALINSGIPVSDFTSANIQLFGREREQPIYVVDGGDNQLNQGDYILFYAERNNGWLDSLLYENPSDIGNPVVSMYNDTINYFFTWNASSNNLRFTEENDQNFNAYTPAPYWLYKLESTHGGFYLEANKTIINTNPPVTFTLSKYEPGEGWGYGHANGVPNGHTQDIGLSTLSPFISSGAPAVKFHAKVVPNSSNGHHYQWRIGSNYMLIDDIYQGYSLRVTNTTFPASLLGNGSTTLNWRIINDQGAPTDFQSITHYSIVYPKLTTLNGLNKDRFFITNSTTSNKIRLDISNANLTNPIAFVLGSIPKRVELSLNASGVWQGIISNSNNGQDQEMILQDLSTVQAIASLTPVTPSAYFTNYTASNIESAYLAIYHPNLEQASFEYITYRSSQEGGAYNVLPANVNELFLQYGGGIDKHILGIRRFALQIYSLSTEKPVGLFLMGKGLSEREFSRFNATNYALNLIPSYGYPSSDIDITSYYQGSGLMPVIPTGRITAYNNAELLDYLEKVKVYEQQQIQTSVYNQETKDWQKHVMHLAGGSSSPQQVSFQGSLNQMKSIIENQNFGGEVTSVFKTSSAPLDPTILTAVSERLEAGISLMTFLAHSSANGFEINVDDPTNWNNAGKYPIVIGNGCYPGDIFATTPSTSDRFVKAQNEGAIAFIGPVKLGFDSPLVEYCKVLYNKFSVSEYGETVGSQMKSTINQIQSVGINSLTELTTSSMLLHGDPMLRLNWHAKPEIDITSQSIFVNPQNINLSVDSIEFNVILTNLGRSIVDTFQLEVRRNFPFTNIDSVYTKNIPFLHYKDTVTFKIPLQANIGTGMNNFSVKADIPTVIPEQYEEITNNTVEYPFIVNIDGIIPVVPYEFAVVPRDSVTVMGSTINPIATYKTYRFEIDTTDLFNSPFRKFALVSGFGGVKKVNPSQWININSNLPSPLTCIDSTVYFWRCAVDSTDLQWRESSFQYIINKEGWGQDHFFQFKKNDFYSLNYNRDIRKREFDTVTRKFFCGVYDNANTDYERFNTMFELDNQVVGYGHCMGGALHVAVFEPNTLNNWKTRWGQEQTHYYGNFNDNGGCAPEAMNFFGFNQSDVNQLTGFQGMLDAVPDGHYVLIYSTRFANYTNWSLIHPSIFNTFQNIGSQVIQPGMDNASFIIFYQKGNPSSFVEVHAAHNPSPSTIPHEYITLELDLKGTNTKGYEYSPIIGPASEWKTIYWKQDPEETVYGDSTRLFIQALNSNGELQLTIDTLFSRNDSILNFNSIIPANQYPFIRFGALKKDTINATPAQIDRWHVLFSPVPEAAIDGSSMHVWTANSTTTEGQDVSFAVDVINISSIPMDSLLVHYWVEDADRNIFPISYPRQDSLRVPDILRDTITFSTNDLAGINTFWMVINPYIDATMTNQDQIEQFYFNNVLQVPFQVQGDDVNPILDVTFDGRHILNGDIIDPASEIVITLKDENPYLIMNDVSDTSRFFVYLTYPNGVQKKIPFIDGSGNTIMQWIPADAQHKKFKIIWPNEFLEDGIYKLSVQGSDRSGNLSGDLDYQVSFEIIRESSITYMMNYPNPFSTSTRFVFTLTGTEVPDEMIIQIMTVTGKVVREITEDQIGTIRIGRNVSEYAWDGTDEFGDPLANGVYLYRVLTQLKGEDIKHRQSGADQYFKKEFGKMYLMR
jgi:hypothetical protein